MPLAAMQDVREIVDRCRTTLRGYKQCRQNALNNPLVTEWLRLDGQDLAALSSPFGITFDLTVPRKRFRELADTIQHRLEMLDNDLGSLTADLSFRSDDLSKMLGIAERIEKQCSEMEPQVGMLRTFENTFGDADRILRQNLEFRNLIRAVPDLCGASANFALGLKVLQCTFSAAAADGNQAVLPEILLKANNLAKQLQRVTLPEALPPVIQITISEQISRLAEAIQRVDNYVDFVDGQLSDLVPVAQKLEQSLLDLKKESTGRIFYELPELIQRCGTTVSSYQKYNKILTAVERLEGLLEEIKLCIVFIKRNMIEDFLQATQTDGSLNPQVFARGYARQYFAGVSGLIRICRSLLGALLGRRMQTERHLEQILASVLISFPRNSSNLNQKKALAKDIGQELLADFGSPFPHQELVQLALSVLNEYAAAARIDFNSRKISFADEGKETPPYTIGDLISRIEVRAENLRELI